MGNFIHPSDLPKLRLPFTLFILSLPLCLPISELNFQLLLHIFGLNFSLHTLASKQSQDLAGEPFALRSSPEAHHVSRLPDRTSRIADRRRLQANDVTSGTVPGFRLAGASAATRQQ